MCILFASFCGSGRSKTSPEIRKHARLQQNDAEGLEHVNIEMEELGSTVSLDPVVEKGRL